MSSQYLEEQYTKFPSSNLVSQNLIYTKYDELLLSLKSNLQDKIQAENSLRDEIINSEQQRSFIEILKQALEARIEELGLKQLLKRSLAKPNKPEHLNSIIDIFIELTNLKHLEITAKKQTSRAESVANDYEEENIILNDQINKLTITIDELYNQIDILKNEKENQTNFMNNIKND